MTSPANPNDFPVVARCWAPSADSIPSDAQLACRIEDIRQQLAQHADPDGADAGRLWQELGLLLYHRSHYDAALWSLEVASCTIPLSARTQLALAACYVDAGHLEAARAIYRHLAALIRLETEALEDLAAGLGRVGEPVLALAVCREAAQRLPNSAGPLLGIVHYLRRLRRPAATVLPYLSRAFELDPRNIECRVSLAWILHAVGRTAEGARLLEGLSVAEMECVRSLTMMHRVFEAASHQDCAVACKYRLDTLAAERLRGRW